ncbi:hypothetical protein FVR03_03125 [Pontibacter qinzhouensis]|uniref:DUF4374 domain-containing protein n=1 Tax=Pontibacter qinzhouensis TaxID=2603253 RepID=A0A5C8KC31_9BACT|nr:hypothetical protein [Pontibacter qinzhouensis]TXK51536.1 hypothetical protein FVR03_03125 [Pontibacter qinzhouensis]
MRASFYKLFLSFLAVAAFSSCDKNDPEIAEPATEFRYVRLLVADGTANTITQVNPYDGTTSTFEAPYANANLYSTASGRFAAMLFGSQNHVQFFDTGLEYHGDHVDVKGTPKFGAMTSSGSRPSHFKSEGTESIVFNDGDGTLSVGSEADFHTPGATMRVIQAGVAPHHGAMAKFSNGNYAITLTDPASSLSGPHGVKIINSAGATVHASSLPVSRLHGNATDGSNAVFGVEGGALVVTQAGQQRLIPNPEGWGTTRVGTVLYAKGANKFIGYTNLKGAYFIDLASNRFTPIIENTDIMQCKLDAAGKNLLALLHDGTLKVYDLASGNLKKEGNVIAPTNTADTFKPVLEATAKYAYIAVPALGEVHQISLTNFSQVQKHTVSGQPTKLAVLGYETNESH